jgi:hypothetical protein
MDLASQRLADRRGEKRAESTGRRREDAILKAARANFRQFILLHAMQDSQTL